MKKLIFLLSLAGVFLLPSRNPIFAEEENVLNKFTVKAVPSAQQLNKNASYFDLLLAPSSSEKLTVELENNTKETLKLKATVNQAITNQNGVVEYSGANVATPPKAAFNISELVTLSAEELSLDAGEKKELVLEVKMPAEKFEGVLAGALYIIELPQTAAEGTIRNVLSREIAILLQTSKAAVVPDIMFKEAKAIQDNERNAIEIEMENVTPTYIKDVTLTYEVLLAGKAFLSGEKNSLKIAPNSTFPFVISLDDKNFEAGKYTAKVQLKSGGNEWKEDLTFSVAKKEAQQLNQTDVSKDGLIKIPWSTVALLTVLFTFIFLVFYLIRKNKKLKQKLGKELSKGKSKSRPRKRKRKKS